MVSVTENTLIILRVLEENGAISRENTLSITQIQERTQIDRKEIADARDYLRRMKYILHSLSPETPMFITPKGINHLQTTMTRRYSISLDAEMVLKYTVGAAPDMGLGILGSEIMSALKMDDERFFTASNQLETFGLAVWNASYVDPTQEGRRAVLRNFLDPSLVQVKSPTKVIGTGGAPYFEGPVNTSGGDIVGRDKIVTFDPKLLEELINRIDASSHTGQEKEDLKADVEEIVQEAQKDDAANETFLGRRLRNIERMAPDIFDVVVTTLTNPAAGLGMAVKKIVEKARAEANETTS